MIMAEQVKPIVGNEKLDLGFKELKLRIPSSLLSVIQASAVYRQLTIKQFLEH